MDKIRFSGMATGLDTDTLIKQMMQPYRMKVDKQKQDKQILQWKQDIYRDIINDVRGLSNSYFNNLNMNDNLLMQKSYAAFDSPSSNPAAATVTANTGALQGNYTVNVTELAKGAKVTGGAVAAGTTNSTKISVLNPAISGDIEFTINVNGNEKVIKLEDAGNKTVGEFISAINVQTNGLVSARFSELTNTFSIDTIKTGKNASIEIVSSKTSAEMVLTFGLDVDDLKEGSNANLTITSPGGSPIPVTTKETNDFTIDGINYSLKGKGISTISVSPNTDKVYDKVMGFITKYNELIEKVNGKVDEKKQYSYVPLTDDQKKDMKPEEIKTWEEKAKQGLIKGDSNLNSMLSEMRSAFFDKIGGVSISLKDLGFSTSKDTTQRGKIVLADGISAEDAKKKFSDALKNNGTEVADFFSKSSTDYDKQGIVQRLNNISEKYTKTFGDKGILLKKAGIKGDNLGKDYLSEQMKEKDKYISELTRKLSERETNYYTKFARLEKAMNQANSQSSWLKQQLGGMQ